MSNIQQNLISKSAIEFIKTDKGHWGLGFNLVPCYDLFVYDGLLFSKFKLPEEIDNFNKIKLEIIDSGDAVAQVIFKYKNNQYVIVIHGVNEMVRYVVNEEDLISHMFNVHSKGIKIYCNWCGNCKKCGDEYFSEYSWCNTAKQN